MTYQLDTFGEELAKTPEFAERTSTVTAWRYSKKLPKQVETLMEFPNLMYILYLISKSAKSTETAAQQPADIAA